MPPIEFRVPVDGALWLVARGYKVFPLTSNAKVPAFSGWQQWAENATEQRIRDFGTANPDHNWGCYCGGSDLLVVDVDNKDKKTGTATFKALLHKHNVELPNTLIVETPTGGYHIYFAGEGRNTAGLLGTSLDTRGTGGYVVAPGSRIDDRAYTISKTHDVAPLPPWLTGLLAQSPEPAAPISNEPVLEGKRNVTLTSLAGTMRSRNMGFEAISAALIAVNEHQFEEPLADSEVIKIAKSISRYEPRDAKAAADFADVPEPTSLALTADSIDPLTVVKRDWIMRNRYIGGFISVIISPGGVGKSILTMLDAVAVATGEELTGFPVASQGAVWIYNTEDPIDELKRRIIALSMHYEIPLNNMAKVHITSGRDNPFILVKGSRDGLLVNQKAIDTTINYIRNHRIRLIIADPFVRTHEVSENDNMAIDKVVWAFQQIAERANCAVGLVHHSRKVGPRADTTSSDADMDIARGASALVYAARVAHIISTMTEEEAESFGVAEARRRWYIRLDNAKANLQPPAIRADWFQKVNVELANGDFVGTLQRVPMASMAEQKKLEMHESTIQDLTSALTTLLKPGECMSVNDVHIQVTTDPRYAHLFRRYSSADKGRRWIIALLKTGKVMNEQVAFTYQLDESKRTRHFVLCREWSVDDMLGSVDDPPVIADEFMGPWELQPMKTRGMRKK